jgi:mono/diheme cytochrome c family protein/glucose/arabinose dehydrogenase
VQLALLLAVLAPQNGDVKDEAQPPLRDEWCVPVPRPLSPEEELATFRVPPGLKVELVAAEPLVVAPVCAVFDERGRLFVCEMRTYMQDADGTDEAAPRNAVVVLTDKDGDGRMDERVEFLSDLALPRAVAPTRGGALVIAPPHLLFARDDDGDGKADDVRVMDSGLQGIASPEHAINGLLYTLDNHFACANAPWRYRWNGERIERQRTAGGGQWGITEDRYGRIYYNDNSNALRCDLYPSRFAVRNPNLGVAPGMGIDIAKGTRPRPSHMTPGVNRGYRKGLLADGRLNEFTGACAPWIYEGDALPERYQGDAFVCEPCGNLVHHFELSYDAQGIPRVETAAPDGAFLTSTDERFRPVFLNEGPDGALYVVDMYRGVLQHRLFVTSWLRQQMEERELESPIDRGRIWRVTRDDHARKPMPDLIGCSWTELGARMGSTNRWVRKTAQRLFVEEGSDDVDARDVLSTDWGRMPHPEGTLSWMWARDALRIDTLREARFLMEFKDVTSRSNAAWLIASLLEREHLDARRFVRTWWGEWTQATALEQLLVLSCKRGGVWRDPLVGVAASHCESAELRGVIASGLRGRELEFLEGTWSSVSWPKEFTPGQTALVGTLAECIVREGSTDRVEILLERSASSGMLPGYASAAFAGIARARSRDAAGQALPHRLARRPRVLDGEFTDPASAARIDELFIWPGKPGTEGMFPRELTKPERVRFERGRAIFEQSCASCHQTSGRGDPAVAPPLRDSRYVLGDQDKLARIVLHGLRGPVTIDGHTWDGEMPGFAADDEDVAGVLTYVRREWNHAADPVTAEFIAEVRQRHSERRGPWHISEIDR